MGTQGCVGWEAATENLGEEQLCQSLPPLPAQEADLVGHHALLKLVLRCHRAAHVTGAALQSSNFHHVVHEGQREAQAAQDVRVLLLLKGCQGGVTGKAAHLSCASNPLQLTETTPHPQTPCTPALGQTQPGACIASSSTVTAANNSHSIEIYKQLPEKLVRLSLKLQAPFPRSIPALWDSFRSQPGRGRDNLHHKPRSCSHYSNASVDFIREKTSYTKNTAN